MKTRCRKIGGLLSVVAVLFLVMFLQTIKTEAAEYRLFLNNSWVSGTISTKGGTNFYKIVLPKAGFVHIDYQGWSIKDSYVEVWDGDLTTRFSRHNVYTSSDTNPVTKGLDFAFEAGTYYVKVFPYSSNVGNYRVRGTFTAAGNNEPEPNNSFDKAVSLAANTKITGFLSQTDTLDFYRIVVPSQQRIKIFYNSRISDTYISIWNSSYERLYRKNVYTGSESSPISYTYEEVLDAGVYYIKIEPYSGVKTGRYQLSWAGSGTVKVSSISITGNQSVIASRSFLLKAAVSPSNATNAAITWSTSNAGVATVNSGGKVTTHRPGTAVITARANDGSGVKASVTVLATPQQMSGLKLKNTARGQLRIIWYRQAGTTGYQLQYGKNSSFSGAKTYQFRNTVQELNVRSLAKGTYYVRVRSYIDIGSTRYYGPWSITKYCNVVA